MQDETTGISQFIQNGFYSQFAVAQEGGVNADNGSVNITDEEKEQLKFNVNSDDDGQSNESNRPFLDTVLYVQSLLNLSNYESKLKFHFQCQFQNSFSRSRAALDCSENDYLALLGSCLVYSLANNKGTHVTATHFTINSLSSRHHFYVVNNQLIN